MTQSQHAIHAAKNRNVWGRDAAKLYAIHHNVLSLYRLARQLQSCTS